MIEIKQAEFYLVDIGPEVGCLFRKRNNGFYISIYGNYMLNTLDDQFLAVIVELAIYYYYLRGGVGN